MAKIVVEFDTQEKTMDVSIDGKELENVTGVDFMRRFDGNRFFGEIRMEDEEEDGMIKIMRIMASENEEDQISTKTVFDKDLSPTANKIAKCLFPGREM